MHVLCVCVCWYAFVVFCVHGILPRFASLNCTGNVTEWIYPFCDAKMVICVIIVHSAVNGSIADQWISVDVLRVISVPFGLRKYSCCCFHILYPIKKKTVSTILTQNANHLKLSFNQSRYTCVVHEATRQKRTIIERCGRAERKNNTILLGDGFKSTSHEQATCSEVINPCILTTFPLACSSVLLVLNGPCCGSRSTTALIGPPRICWGLYCGHKIKSNSQCLITCH